jgi:hypothetical protein
MEEWEKKLLINKTVQDFNYLGEIIKYKRMDWMRQNEIQRELFKLIDGKPEVDTNKFQLTVLKEGTISGPWPADMKEAVLINLEPEIADSLTKAILGKNRIESKEELIAQIEGLKKKLKILEEKQVLKN